MSSWATIPSRHGAGLVAEKRRTYMRTYLGLLLRRRWRLFCEMASAISCTWRVPDCDLDVEDGEMGGLD